MFLLCLLISVVAPYLLCAVNPAIIVTRIKSGEDIRKIGSGNPGLTNTLRTQGKGAAAAVLIFDVLKGVAAIFLIKLIYLLMSGELGFKYDGTENLLLWTGAVMSVLGHVYPVYYRFKGGKAILVTVSVLFVIDWISAAILLSLFLIILAVSKYVSLGSIVAGSLMPLCVYLIGRFIHNNGYVLISTAFSALIALLLVYKHRSNIKRLVNGTEKKITEKRRTIDDN